MRFWNKTQTMGAAAAIMAVSVLLSRVMGLVRDKVISYYFGASLESDLYFASFVIPDFLNYLLAGGYFSITLIPFLSDYFQKDEADARRFFSAVFLWMCLAMACMAGLGMYFATDLAALAVNAGRGIGAREWILRHAGWIKVWLGYAGASIHPATPTFSPEAVERLAFFLRIILPAQVFFIAGACLSALLYLRRQFLVPALVPLIYNGAIILGGLVLLSRGMEGFCWGVLVGACVGNFLLPLWAAARGKGEGGGIGLSFTVYHPGLWRYALVTLPLMLGQSVVVLDEQLIRLFGFLGGPGAVSWLNYARRLMLVPVGVVAQAAGVASYPFLAKLAAERDAEGFAQAMRAALTATTMYILPLAAWMAVAAGPTVRLIFEQGRFAAADAEATAVCLRVMLSSVVCWGVQQIVGRAFYAHKDTLRPSVTGTVLSLLSIPLYAGLGYAYGATGVAAASVMSVAGYTVVVAWLWRSRHGGAGFRGLGRTLGVGAGLSAVAALAAWPCLEVARLFPAWPLTGALGAIAASGLAFAAVFLGLGLLVAPDLVRPLAERLLKPLRRRKR